MERVRQAMLCAQAQIDLHFCQYWYGSMEESAALAAKVVQALDDEGRLS
jgi:hypothetical protein